MAVELPLLLSIPHGGSRIPDEVANNVAATEFDVLADGDAHTAELYDFSERVAHVLVADVARAFVDLNRAPDDLPPANPDGIVKTQTVHEVELYHEPLSDQTVAQLIDRYHAPYHSRLKDLAADRTVSFGIDCHSMLSEPPKGFAKRGPRPAFCVSNAAGDTASAAEMEALCTALEDAFELRSHEVGRNDPFSGGYIVRHHALGGLPWLQLEINRALYLDARTLRPLPTVGATREALYSALQQFVETSI